MIRAACSARSAARDRRRRPCAARRRSAAACRRLPSTATRRRRSRPGSGSRTPPSPSAGKPADTSVNQLPYRLTKSAPIASPTQCRDRHQQRREEQDRADLLEPVVEHLDLRRRCARDSRPAARPHDRRWPRRAAPRGSRSIVPDGQPIARQMPLAYQSIQRCGHGIGLGARRVGRGDPEQLEAAHRPQPLGELAIVEPAAMPFAAACRCAR